VSAYRAGIFDEFQDPCQAKWLETELVEGFLQMTYHKYHPSSVLLHQVIFPNATVTPPTRVLPPPVACIVVLARSTSPYAFLKIDIATKAIVVTEGLNYNLTHWY